MPTRKQRRRRLKEKRHDYEFVYVDSEGNQVDDDDVPEEIRTEPRERSEPARNGTKPDATAKQGSGKQGSGKQGSGKQKPQSRQRARRTPQPPSWQRAAKRGGLLGIVIFALFSLTAKGNWGAVLPLALVYTLLFIPFTYMIDRFAYRRYLTAQERSTGTGSGGGSRPAKKR